MASFVSGIEGDHRTMGRLTVTEIARELATIRLDQRHSLASILPDLRCFLELDALLVFCPEERLVGWGVARLDTDGMPRTAIAAFAQFLAHAPRRFWFFDPLAPERGQRDRAIDTAEHVGEAVYRASPIFREVWHALGFVSHRELRALVCEGPRLTGWVGGFRDGPLDPAQQQRLTALVPALRRRLSSENRLRTEPLTATTLAAILDQLADAAFVLGPRGEIAFANRAGRAHIERDRESLAELVTQRGGDQRGWECLRIRAAGVPPHTLVLARRDDESQHDTTRARCAASRWGLTPRQCDVLLFVVRGRCNAAIAAELGITERAVEFHITGIFDRARVNSRAELIARVLGAPLAWSA